MHESIGGAELRMSDVALNECLLMFGDMHFQAVSMASETDLAAAGRRESGRERPFNGYPAIMFERGVYQRLSEVRSAV